MKIICIGRNYVVHIHELQNAIPEDPVIFQKPDTCSSRCGGTFGVMMGADVSLPYRTNALRFDASGSELSSGRVDAAFQAGMALRAGVRYSIPLCHSMGFFMEPQVVYKAVLDRTDEAFVEGRGGSRVGDGLGMGMQGGVYLSLVDGCPMTKGR